MKNVIKPDSYNDSFTSKSLNYGLSGRLIPTIALGLTLTAVPLTGCLLDDPALTDYQPTTVVTQAVIQEEPVQSANSEESSEDGVELHKESLFLSLLSAHLKSAACLSYLLEEKLQTQIFSLEDLRL